MLRRLSGVVVVLSACGVHLEVPGKAIIVCASTDDCPSNWTCDPESGLCVSPDEQTPPRLTLSPVNRSAGLMTLAGVVYDRQADDVTLTATLTRAGAETPIVLPSAPLPATPSGTSFTIEWDAPTFFGGSTEYVPDSLVLHLTPSDAAAGKSVDSNAFFFGNDAPVLSQVELPSVVSGFTVVQLTIADTAADPVDVTSVVVKRAGQADIEIDLESSSIPLGGISALTTSLAGEPHAFGWDTSPLAVNGAATLEVTVTDIFGASATLVSPTPFELRNLSPPRVELVYARSDGERHSGAVPIVYRLIDDESDLADVDVDVSTDGGHVWFRASELPLDISEGTGGLASRPDAQGGLLHTFVWDSGRDLGTGQAEVAVRMTPRDSAGIGDPLEVIGHSRAGSTADAGAASWQALGRASLSWQTKQARFGDVDGDGHADLVATAFGVAGIALVSWGDGASLAGPIDYLWSESPIVDVLPCDREGDGTDELYVLTQEKNAGQLWQVTYDAERRPSWSKLPEGPPLEVTMACLSVTGGTVHQIVIVPTGGGDARIIESFGVGGTRYSPIVPIDPRCVLAADGNDDGLTDLVIGGNLHESNQPGILAIIPRDPIFGFDSPIMVPVGESIESCTSADFDGDGDDDFALSIGNDVVALVHIGASSVFIPQQLNSVVTFTCALTAGQLDGDSDPDLACVSTVESWEAHDMHAYYASGTSPTLDPMALPDQASAAVIDVPGGGLLTWDNDGSSFFVRDADDTGFRRVRAGRSAYLGGEALTKLVDLDGDGSLELADVVLDQQGAGQVYLYDIAEDTSALSLVGSFDLTLPFGPSVAAWTDVDSDGDADLVYSTDVGLVVRQAVPGAGPLGLDWQSPAPLAALASPPNSLWTGDFDGDRVEDLLVVFDVSTAVLFGGTSTVVQGDALALDTDSIIFKVEVGDLEGDGRTDVVLAGRQQLFVVRSSAARVLSSQGPIDLDFGAGILRLFDLEGDGALELLVSDGNVEHALVRDIGGVPTLEQLSPHPSELGKPQWLPADMDGDGLIDLVQYTTDSLGLGVPTLQAETWLARHDGSGATVLSPSGVVSPDVGRGALDNAEVVSLTPGAPPRLVLTGSSGFAQSAVALIAAPRSPQALASDFLSTHLLALRPDLTVLLADDMDFDGAVDLVTAGQAASTVQVFPGERAAEVATGQFGAAREVTVPGAAVWMGVLCQLDADAPPELALVTTTAAAVNQIEVVRDLDRLLAGEAPAAVEIHTLALAPIDLLCLDLDADGHNDLVALTNDGSSIYLAVLAGGPAALADVVESSQATGAGSFVAGVADIDADGASEVVLFEAVASFGVSSNLSLWVVHPGASLADPLVFDGPLYAGASLMPPLAHRLIPADLDHDGRMDLVVPGEAAAAWVPLVQNAGGDFSAGVAFSGPATGAFATRLDDDEDIDFLATNGDWVEANAGELLAQTQKGTPLMTTTPVAADIDADGLLDLLAYHGTTREVGVQRPMSRRSLTLDPIDVPAGQGALGLGAPVTVAFERWQGDGVRLDLQQVVAATFGSLAAYAPLTDTYSTAGDVMLRRELAGDDAPLAVRTRLPLDASANPPVALVLELPFLDAWQTSVDGDVRLFIRPSAPPVGTVLPFTDGHDVLAPPGQLIELPRVDDLTVGSGARFAVDDAGRSVLVLTDRLGVIEVFAER